MRGKLIDLTGQTFGRLLVIKKLYYSERRRTFMWMCRCSCEKRNEVEVCGHELREDETRSCGCLVTDFFSPCRYEHGMTHTQTYSSWTNMKTRCLNPNATNYAQYGGRGIKVCDKWLKFLGFFGEMGEAPEDHEIERVDVDGNYCIENCIWLHYRLQGRNKGNSRLVTHNGVTKHLVEWLEGTGLSYQMVASRVDRGESLEEAMSPVNRLKTMYLYKGEQVTLNHLSQISGYPMQVIYNRIVTRKWEVERAITEPLRFNGRVRKTK